MRLAQILVVEDERIVAADLQRRLRRMGHTVLGTAVSGEEALEKAAALRPDVVLMDIKLRGAMSGLEAGESIRTQWQIPVVYMTAYAEAKGLAPAQGTQPALYICKPFDEQSVQAALTLALERHRPTPL
jgi:CheY-like chemotaxis protein